jgi:tetratricopeptide (TPR) repeat protein
VPGANLDLAIARFFTEGPVSALAALEHTPAGDQSADYWLLKASLLDTAGRRAEADQILRRGFSAPISRPAIVQQAALLLLRQNRNDLALELLNKGSGSDPELRLLGAIVLGRMERPADAEKVLKAIESEWPEWDRPYLAHGLLLERSQPLEAGRKLRIATALGSQDPAARCALARLAATTPSDPQCACKVRLDALLFANCARP